MIIQQLGALLIAHPGLISSILHGPSSPPGDIPPPKRREELIMAKINRGIGIFNFQTLTK